MTTPVVVWPNSAAAALTHLRSVLPARSESYAAGARMVAHVPSDQEITSNLPLVMVRPDGSTTAQRLNRRALVRVTCWHSTEYEAMALAGLCEALLVAHSGPEIRSVEHVSGPLPGVDPQNDTPLATTVVAAHMRPAEI